jgi:hypothetical protein
MNDYFLGFLSEEETKKGKEALMDPDWVIAKQNELNQSERQKVWKLVPRTKGKSVIGTKWVSRTLDNIGIVMRDKAKLDARLLLGSSI